MITRNRLNGSGLWADRRMQILHVLNERGIDSETESIFQAVTESKKFATQGPRERQQKNPRYYFNQALRKAIDLKFVTRTDEGRLALTDEGKKVLACSAHNMTKLEFSLFDKTEFTDKHRAILAEMLSKQRKVQGDPNTKIDRCHFLCIVSINSKPVAVGAIKDPTKPDFDPKYADLPKLADKFQAELGYLFTCKEVEGKGLATHVVRMLLSAYGDRPIMASTEVCMNPYMVRILEKSGFKAFGKPWKSEIHGNMLGLFLRER